MPEFEISSIRNPRIQTLRELQKAKGRREQGLFLAEGVKMVREALRMGLCRTLIVQQDRRAEYAELEELAGGAEILAVSEAVMAALSDAKTPQGVLCTIPIDSMPHTVAGRRIACLDGVQDPGNVGTILRTADAAGFDGVLMSSACADLFSAKTLRATMGSVFRVPVYRTDDLPETLLAYRRKGYDIASTELGGQDFYAGCPRGKAILVIGSEGHGVSPEVHAVSTHHLALPMRGGAESLNAAVAAGIMIYEMARESAGKEENNA